MIELWYMHEDECCTKIKVDMSARKVWIENLTDYSLKKAFGNNVHPTYNDFLYFIKSRCVSKNLGNIKEYLTQIGLEEYDELEIVYRTNGKMSHDKFWIKFI